MHAVGVGVGVDVGVRHRRVSYACRLWLLALASRPQMRLRSDSPASLRATGLRSGSSSRRISPMRVPTRSRISVRHALNSSSGVEADGAWVSRVSCAYFSSSASTGRRGPR